MEIVNDFSNDIECAINCSCSHGHIENVHILQIVILGKKKKKRFPQKGVKTFTSGSLFVLFRFVGLPECDALHFLSINSIHPPSSITHSFILTHNPFMRHLNRCTLHLHNWKQMFDFFPTRSTNATTVIRHLKITSVFGLMGPNIYLIIYFGVTPTQYNVLPGNGKRSSQ